GLPAAAIKRAALPRVLHLRAQLGQDDLVALLRLRALEPGRPVLGVRRRPPRRVVARRPGRAHLIRRRSGFAGLRRSTVGETTRALMSADARPQRRARAARPRRAARPEGRRRPQIGRASCRERVEVTEGGVVLKKKKESSEGESVEQWRLE